MRTGWKVTSLILLSFTTILSGCMEGDPITGKAVATLNQRAKELLDRGDNAGAVARLQSAVDLDPKQPLTLHNLAVAYQAAQNYPQAEATYRKLIELLPARKAEYLQSIGVVLEAQGDQARLVLLAEKGDDASKAERDNVLARCTPGMPSGSPAQLKTIARSAYQSAQVAYRDAAKLNPTQALTLEKQAVDLQQAIDSLDNPARSSGQADVEQP